MVTPKETSERLLRVVFPDSRELKWPWPAFRLITRPVRVIRTRFDIALCVFIAILGFLRCAKVSGKLAFGQAELGKGLGLTSKDHVHASIHHLQRSFNADRIMRSKLLHELIEYCSCDVAMGAFAAAEDHFYLNLVTLFEELRRLFYTNLQVARANAHGKANTLDFNLLTLCALLSHLLFLLVFEMTVVGEFTDWWLGQWRNLNQVHAFLPCQFDRLCGGHDTERLALIINNSHFRSENIVVCLKFLNFELRLLEPTVAVNAHFRGINVDERIA